MRLFFQHFGLPTTSNDSLWLTLATSFLTSFAGLFCDLLLLKSVVFVSIDDLLHLNLPFFARLDGCGVANGSVAFAAALGFHFRFALLRSQSTLDFTSAHNRPFLSAFSIFSSTTFFIVFFFFCHANS